MREENIRLQRKLQREMERREALCRQLSESESSLEMDDERYRKHPIVGLNIIEVTIAWYCDTKSHVSNSKCIMTLCW